MAYKGEGKGRPVKVFEGTSEESLDNAIRAAVHASGVRHGTTLDDHAHRDRDEGRPEHRLVQGVRPPRLVASLGGSVSPTV